MIFVNLAITGVIFFSLTILNWGMKAAVQNENEISVVYCTFSCTHKIGRRHNESVKVNPGLGCL